MMDTMLAPVFMGNGQIEQMERPRPHASQGQDVIVQVEACGICGTDLNILAVPPAHKATPGIIIGHEAIGIVVETGPDVTHLGLGDRVAVAPRLTCGKCVYCRRGLDNQCIDYRTIGTTLDGGFAPYLSAPASALFKIAPAVSRDDAVFFEPLSCVVGAVKRVPIQPGASVAIIGAGPMGMLFALMYQTLGAGRTIVIDIAPSRLAFARQVGVDVALNSAEVEPVAAVREITGIGADVVVDAVGNQIDLATRLARRGGDVILFGLRPHDIPPVNQYTITRHDLTVHGVFVGLHPFEQTIQLLESQRLHPSVLITHRLPLSELAAGIELMRTQQAMKVIIETQPKEPAK